MSGRDGIERRQAERLPIQCKVSYRVLKEGCAQPRTTAAETVNLSATGLCLVSPDPIERETELALEMELEGKEEAVVAIGRVVWCDRGSAQSRIGICFTWLREEDRRALAVIAEFVQSQLDS